MRMPGMVMLVCCSLSGYSQLKNYDDHGAIPVLGDKVTLDILPREVALTEKEALAPVVGAALPPLIDLAVKTIDEKVKQHALKFKGEYTAFAGGDSFYRNPETVALPALRLTRTVRTKDGRDRVAVELVLTPELSEDRTAFRYVIRDTCIYRVSAARTRGRYDYVDLSVAVTLKAVYVQKDQYKIETVRTTELRVPMVHVGHTERLDRPVYSGWIPFPPHSNGTVVKDDTARTTKLVADGNGKETKTLTTTIKHGVHDYEDLPANTGPYEVDVTVTETNPFKIRAEDRTEFIEKTAAPTGEVVKAVVDVVGEE